MDADNHAPEPQDGREVLSRRKKMTYAILRKRKVLGTTAVVAATVVVAVVLSNRSSTQTEEVAEVSE